MFPPEFLDGHVSSQMQQARPRGPGSREMPAAGTEEAVQASDSQALERMRGAQTVHRAGARHGEHWDAATVASSRSTDKRGTGGRLYDLGGIERKAAREVVVSGIGGQESVGA